MGIFARVLRDTLVRHCDVYPDGAYSDPVWYPLRRIGIAAEIIDRLKHAAVSSASATLSVRDLELVIQGLRCTPQEQRMLHLALVGQAVEGVFRKRFKRAGLDIETAGELAGYVYQILMEQPLADMDALARGTEVVAPEYQQRIERALPLFEALNLNLDAYQEAVAGGRQEDVFYWRSVAHAGVDALLSLLPEDASELRLNLLTSRNALDQS